MNLLKHFYIFALSIFTLSALAQNNTQSHQQIKKMNTKKLALVYKGPGSCVENCSESPAEILKTMGFEVQFVGPKEENPAIFKNVTVWLQPGGLVREQYKAMSPILKENIFNFVKSGGAYVGICAGAFLASEKYSWKSKRDGVFVEYGLNFFPGTSTIFDAGRTTEDKPVEFAMMRSSFSNGKSRHLYWEEGPVFFPSQQWADNGIEITGLYPNNQVATMRRQFGKGRVYVTAFHPEAPQDWRDYYHLNDEDGLDFDYLKEMITWAIQK